MPLVPLPGTVCFSMLPRHPLYRPYRARLKDLSLLTILPMTEKCPCSDCTFILDTIIIGLLHFNTANTGTILLAIVVVVFVVF